MLWSLQVTVPEAEHEHKIDVMSFLPPGTIRA